MADNQHADSPEERRRKLMDTICPDCGETRKKIDVGLRDDIFEGSETELITCIGCGIVVSFRSTGRWIDSQGRVLNRETGQWMLDEND